jgi:hypothetical protein
MFFRLLIFAILGVVVYRVLKSVMGGAASGRVNTTYDPPDRVDDVMVKDPQCGTYFPRRDGVTVTTSHEVLYFCSNECRDRYLAQRSKRS